MVYNIFGENDVGWGNAEVFQNTGVLSRESEDVLTGTFVELYGIGKVSGCPCGMAREHTHLAGHFFFGNFTVVFVGLEGITVQQGTFSYTDNRREVVSVEKLGTVELLERLVVFTYGHQALAIA